MLKKLIFLFLFSCAFLSGTAQDTVFNPLTGKCIIWRAGEWSRIEGHLFFKRKFGKWKYFDSSGKLKRRAKYRFDRQEGIMMEYDETQIIHWRYKKDALNGETKIFDSTGNLAARLHFSGGEQEGLQYRYFSNGTISEISTWRKSRKNGEQKNFYADGFLRSRLIFHDGRKNGIEEQFHDWPSDSVPQRWYSGRNSFNFISGEVAWYYASGAIFKTASYDNGKKSGTEKTYDDKGKLLRTVEYKNNLRHGIEERFDASGILRYRINWFEDVPQEAYTLYQVNGLLRDSGTFVNGKVQGRRIIYYNSGKKMLQADLADGVANGPTMQFGEDGKLLMRGFYTDGKRSGEWRAYYPNDSLRSITFYVHGKPDSLYRRFAASGKEVYTARYVSGKISGTPVIHDETGKELSPDDPEYEAIALSSRPVETFVDESLMMRLPDFDRYRRELIEYYNLPERIPVWNHGWKNWNDSIARFLPDSLKPSPKYVNDTVWYQCTIDATGNLHPHQYISGNISGSRHDAVRNTLVLQKGFEPGERLGIAASFDLPLPVVMRSEERKKKIDFRKMKRKISAAWNRLL